MKWDVWTCTAPSFCSSHEAPSLQSPRSPQRKRPSGWGCTVGFPVRTVRGTKDVCQPTLWPVLDLASSGASLGPRRSSLCCQGCLQIFTGTFTVHLYLWNTFGSLSPLDVCLPFSALLRELWKAGTGTLQAFPVGASFRLNFPLEFHFPGDPNRKPNR